MHISTLNKCQNASLGARQSEDGKDIVYAREGEGRRGGMGRGERIDYTPRITLGPFSIIFR